MFAASHGTGPQGGAGRSTPELEARREWHRFEAARAGDVPYGNADDSERSKWMGRCHNFKMPERILPDGSVDEGKHRIDVTIASRKWLVGMQNHKEPVVRFPWATRRAAGRTWPGEERRQRRKAAARKTTRGEVQTLCKYMIWKAGKFMPGKMV
jgi:hypothetical protein